MLAWTSTLDSHWNDLALKPVFVPFVHEALKHLARYVEPRPGSSWRDVFDSAALVAPGGPAAGMDPADLVDCSPWRGARTARTRRSGAPGVRWPCTDSGGRPGPDAAGAPHGGGIPSRAAAAAGAADVAIVAVNVSAAESDLAPLDTAEFVRAMTAAPRPASNRAGSPTWTRPELERRQSAVVVLLLAAGLRPARRRGRAWPAGCRAVA